MKGLVPCAGLGTRLHPLSLAVPKELLPIGAYPAVHYHIQDLLAADIRDIIVVINEKKTAIRDYLQGIFPEVGFQFVYQEEPKGLAQAMLLARESIGENPIVMLLPDNIFFGSESLSKSLTEAHKRTGRSCVTLFKDGRYKRGSRSGMEPASTKGRFNLIKAVHPIENIPIDRQVFFGPAAFLFTPAVFNHLEAESRAWDFSRGEYSERPAVEELVKTRSLDGVWVEGQCFDIGTIVGYLECLQFVLKHNQTTPADSAESGQSR